MRVLHVASGRLYGGIERMLVTIARAAGAVPSLESAFAVASPGRLVEELREAGAPVHVLGDVRLRHPGSVLAGRAVLRSVLRTSRPDVVVCHAPWSYALFAGIGRQERRPVVWWQHDRATGRSAVERWARTLPCDLVISNSRWTARTAQLVQPRARVEVLYCPVAAVASAAAARGAIRTALGAAHRHVVLLAASRLDPWKGHLSLLRALRLIAPDPSWVLWIAGGVQRPRDARYLARLQTAARDLGIASRVRFLGERRDIAAILAAADVVVQANERPEPFGVLFAEALLAGRPVVTTDTGGAPEIVDHSCGRLVTAGDLEALGGTLAELVADPALRARLGAAGPAHAAARCAPGPVLRRLGDLLREYQNTAAA
ncbi:MAG TPA: glycosyltransferase [Vicinamibacterales bacterium]|nr:glycosyltransferase [Vicinamibacterales bacterium]